MNKFNIRSRMTLLLPTINQKYVVSRYPRCKWCGTYLEKLEDEEEDNDLDTGHTESKKAKGLCVACAERPPAEDAGESRVVTVSLTYPVPTKKHPPTLYASYESASGGVEAFEIASHWRSLLLKHVGCFPDPASREEGTWWAAVFCEDASNRYHIYAPLVSVSLDCPKELLQSFTDRKSLPFLRKVSFLSCRIRPAACDRYLGLVSLVNLEGWFRLPNTYYPSLPQPWRADKGCQTPWLFTDFTGKHDPSDFTFEEWDTLCDHTTSIFRIVV